MTPDEFRRAGHDLIERIAAYLEDPAAALPNVVPDVEPGDVRRQFPQAPPHTPDTWDEVDRDIDDLIMPNIANWQHPNWFAYFPANTSYASVLGDLLAAGLAQQGMSWVTSPVCTELETLMMDWMLDLLGLPTKFRSDSPTGGGAIQGSASEGVLVGILAARWKATDGNINHDGDTSRLTAYISDQAHSSLEKGLRIAGIGTDRVRKIGHDDAFAMDAGLLQQQIEADVEAGLRPFFVCATRGTTSSMAMDPTTTIGEICRHYGAWLHVDAAMAGIAALADEYRWINDGLKLADSYSTNPHKWMGVGFDCSLWWTDDREAMLGALSILPEYLRSAAAESGQAIDYRDWQIPLGRRFRALKLWFALRLDGAPSIADRLRRDIALTDGLAERFAHDERFVFAAPTMLDLLCVRLAATPGETDASADERTDALIGTVNASRRAHVTRTVLDGRPAMRVCIGAPSADSSHVDEFWHLVDSLATTQATTPHQDR